MKILHVIDDMNYGGAQSLLSDLVLVQKRNNINVSVLVLKACSSGFIQKLKIEGIPVYILTDNGSVYNPLLTFKIICYFNKFEIVHVHLFPAQYWVALAKLLSFSNVLLITTEHSTQNKRRNNIILKYVDDFVYRFMYKCTVCCSDKALETFRVSYPQANAVSIPNGIDIDRFIQAVSVDKMELFGSNTIFVITMVARFQYPKRQDTVIKALQNLPKDIHAVFVGGEGTDNYMEKCKRLIADMGLQDRTHFLGLRDDVPSILKATDVIILASEYEGLSLSSIEGMSVDRPFVATDVNGLREIVDGAGLLFDNGDYERLASIIFDLYNNPVQCAMIAKQCIERAKHYDIKIMEKAYHELYNRICTYKKNEKQTFYCG